MIFSIRRPRRLLYALAIFILIFAAVIQRSSAELMKVAIAPLAASAFHDDGKVGKPGLSRRQQIREALIWHELNKLRLDRSPSLRAALLAPEALNQDVNDIAILQGDPRAVIPANAFDLGGRVVQFTPSGGGYTISTGIAAFDANIGTKLNMTAAPAVNPKIELGAEPGDDAYIMQSIGFNFSFFGASYSDVAITSNGNLTFRPAGISQSDFDQGTVFSVASAAEFQSGLPRIGPYWHDLDARAGQTQGESGVYLRRDNDRIVVTWNNIRDFPNDPAVDRGVHRFQVTLFNTGHIAFVFDSAQLTSQAISGITPGASLSIPSFIDLSNPGSSVFGGPTGEFFSTQLIVDTIGAVQAFYATHPNRDVYDFVYLVTDFQFNLGNAFAFYLPLRNDASGIGLPVGDSGAAALVGSQRIEGILNLANISQSYPASPVTRFFGANHGLSIMGQEQGHRWLTFIDYPGVSDLLLGRDDSHWSFFFNIESTISSPAAPRSSSAEGNVWRDNGNGTFTSINLIDGYSRLDHYLMGLRPSSDVPDTFVITNPSGSFNNRSSNPAPNVTTNGTRQNVTIDQILQANGARNPDSTRAPKSFRAAVVLILRPGAQASQATIDKITRYRLAWESYFSQSTDHLASINTGLADQTVSRVIAAASAASFKPTLSPGEIAALFGLEMSDGTASAVSQPLPTMLAGAEVRINGVLSPLFYVSPTQINFQVPLSIVATTFNPLVPSSTALIEVFKNGQLIRAGAFQIAPAVPGIFTYSQNGRGPAAAVDAFTGALPPFNAKQANGQANIIAAFGTGLGVDATDIDGNVNASVQATIDGAPVTVNYAGRAPGFTGLNQFNIVFPASITSGNHTLVISRNGIPSQEVMIAVQ